MKKILAHNAKDFVRKEEQQPVEKPADIGTKPIPSWINKNGKYYKREETEYQKRRETLL